MSVVDYRVGCSIAAFHRMACMDGVWIKIVTVAGVEVRSPLMSLL